ncbi:MAG: alpha/beta hydrolase [Ruminococcus sp.]|nr:alpha/beta hydrolase [Ruminococcus sp.]
MLYNAKNGTVPIDGTEMCYASFGHGKKVLAVLPGLSDGLATVSGKALILAPPYRDHFDEYTVYMFSRRNELPQGFTIRDMAADQARALKALGIEKADVMGVSQGGMIAQCIAADFPEIVDKLVLVVTAPRVNEISSKCVGYWIELAEKGDHKQIMIDTAEKSYTPEKLEKYRRVYPVLGRVGKPKSYDRFLVNARAILGFDATDEIKKIACPTLILGGGDDKIVGGEASRELNSLIPGSKLIMYPELGHALYEEAKDFYKQVFDFLDS